MFLDYGKAALSMPGEWDTLKCSLPKGCDQWAVGPVLCSRPSGVSAPAAGACFQRQPGPFQLGSEGREPFAASVCFQVNFFRWSLFYFVCIYFKWYSKKHIASLVFLLATLSSAFLGMKAGETVVWGWRADLLTPPRQQGRWPWTCVKPDGLQRGCSIPISPHSWLAPFRM